MLEICQIGLGTAVYTIKAHRLFLPSPLVLCNNSHTHCTEVAKSKQSVIIYKMNLSCESASSLAVS